MCIMSVGVRIVVGPVRPRAWLECSRKLNATLRLNYAVNRRAKAECQCEKHLSRRSHFREGEGGACFSVLIGIVLSVKTLRHTTWLVYVPRWRNGRWSRVVVVIVQA